MVINLTIRIIKSSNSISTVLCPYDIGKSVYTIITDIKMRFNINDFLIMRNMNFPYQLSRRVNGVVTTSDMGATGQLSVSNSVANHIIGSLVNNIHENVGE